MRTRSWAASGAICLSLLGVLGLAVAQQTERRPGATDRPGATAVDPARRAPRAEAGAKLTPADEQLARCLAIDNHLEVRLAEFAATKAQSEQVKQFAKQMQDDHTAFLAKLREWTGGRAAAGESAADARAPGARLATEPRRESVAAVDPEPKTGHYADGRGVDFLQIKREVADECLKTFEKELSAKEPDQFDKCYMGAQVMAHLGMIDMLKVFERHASPQFAQQLQQAQTTTQQHLDQAKVIVKQLEQHGAAPAQAAAPGATTR